VYKVKIAALLKTKKGPFSAWVVEKTAKSHGGTEHEITTTTYPTMLGTTLSEMTTTAMLATTVTVDQRSTIKENGTPTTQPTLLRNTVSSVGGIVKTSSSNEQTTVPLPKRHLTESTTVQSPKTSSTTETKITSPNVQTPTTVETTERKNPAPPKTKETLPVSYTRVAITNTISTVSESLGTCEQILPSMCSDNGYDTTKIIFKQNQGEMIKHVEKIWSNISPICKDKENLKRFICAVNFPYCSARFQQPFLPCQSMCTVTKNSCSLPREDMWPAELDCGNFPDIGELCVTFGK